MCAIAGYWGSREIDPLRVSACLGLMRRRGPDTAAFRHWTRPTGGHAYLLHSRLSIIDLNPRSDQPFRIGTQWIVTNGELYNYQELREELRNLGIVFRTDSDTEVLLQVLLRFGTAGLDRCEGMWAFAAYDESRGSLLLCRDRFGEKPLYLYRDGPECFFGSEVKFITALLGKTLPVNTEHLLRYLVYGYKFLYKYGSTFFAGLTEVPPSTFIQLDTGGDESRQTYWTPSTEPDESMSYGNAIAGVRERLLRAVNIRLRADVPLAFCMSGGVDSNSIIAIARRVFDYDVHGFTAANSDSRYEERDTVDRAVRELDIHHTTVPSEPHDFLPQLRELVRYHDAPVYTITYYLHWLLMQSIHQHGYRISVSGTAADELFSGYYDHHLAYLYEVRGDPELGRASREAWLSHIGPMVRNPFLKNPELFVQDPSFRAHLYLDADFFSSCLTDGWTEPFTEKTFTNDLLRNRMLNEMFHENVPAALHEDDLNAMYYSVENRSPYLDRNLFEFCYRIPTRHLIRAGFAKAVLRDSMRGIVPDCVLDNRRKVGFNAPISSILDTRNPGTREFVLDDGPIFGHVRRRSIEDLLSKSDFPNSESKFLFYFISSKMFLEEMRP